MSDTNFVDQQTVIVADWLNDVNDAVYKPLNGLSGTINRSIVERSGDFLNAKDFGVDGIDGDQDSFTNLRTTGGNAYYKLPQGNYQISSLDWRGWLGGLIGAGMINTVIQGVDASTLLNTVETSDALGVASPFVLEKLMLFGASLSTTGIDTRYRHHYDIRDVYIAAINGKGFHSKDGYVGRSTNMRISTASIGMHLEGSDHGSIHTGLGITACTDTHLLLESNGTANDGNDGLSFFGIIISDGTGYGIKDSSTSSIYQGGYIGENIGQTVFSKLGAGTALLEGGVFSFGQTTNSFGFNPAAGMTIVRGMKFNGQTNGNLANLITGPATGKIKFIDNNFGGISVGGGALWPGDPIGYGPSYPCFVPKYAKAYSFTPTNCTVGTADGTNTRAWTVTVGPVSGTASLHIYANLVNRADWVEGAAYIQVVYLSTSDFNMRFCVDQVGTLPIKAMGTLPNTSTVQTTRLSLDQVLDGGAYTQFEFYNDNVVLGSKLQIFSINLTDSRGMPLGNIWKC